MDFLGSIFDSSPFPQRWYCGTWTATHGWVHIISDVVIWSAYMTIPIILFYFVTKREGVPFPRLFWLFGLFILSCGTGHLIEAGLFWWPMYRLSGAMKVVTAVASWGTVVALIPVIPKAMAMRGPDELEEVVKERTAELQLANERLTKEIEERREIEARLLESEQRHQALYDTIPDMLMSIDPETGQILKCNQTTLDKLGYQREELLKGRIMDLYDPDGLERAAEVFATFQKEGIVRNEELAMRCKDGTVIQVSLNSSAVRDEEGRILYRSSAWRDITEQKNAEEKFRQVIEPAPNGIIMVDSTGKITLVNSETERLFGYEREELLGESVNMLLPARFRQSHPHHQAAFFKKPEARAMGAGRDLYAIKKNGTEFPVEIGLRPILLEGELVILSSIVDITERKNAEEKLKIYARDLKMSNEELEQFAYIASHDLKEPLRGIHNYATFLIEDYGDKLDREGTERLETLQRLAKRMDGLLDSLLYFSRVGRVDFHFEKLNVDQIVNEVLDSLSLQIKENDVEIRRSSRLPQTRGDRIRVAEVFQNLISNAIKYNDKDQKWVEIGSRRDDSGTRVFYVRDNGIGIKEQFHERIFTIFKRLHGRDKFGGGTGVGLTIVRRLVERHHGSIWIESTPGEGSTFYFTFGGTND